MLQQGEGGWLLAARSSSLLVTLIMDGDNHEKEIMENNTDILMAKLVEKVCIHTEMTWSRYHQDIVNHVETMGCTMMDFGLLELANTSTEAGRKPTLAPMQLSKVCGCRYS